MKDPCEIHIEPSDDTGGSSPLPPTEPDEQSLESEQPVFPRTDYEIPTPDVDQQFSRIVAMIDSGNYYPSRRIPNFGFGIAVPSEFKFPLKNYVIEDLEFEDYEEAKIIFKKEDTIRNSEESNLDVGDRDIFRHMLGKVWFMRDSNIGTYSSNSGLRQMSIHRDTNGHSRNIEHAGPDKYPLIYDFTKRKYIIPGGRPEEERRRETLSRTPFYLYEWQPPDPLNGPNAILPSYYQFIGLRFHIGKLLELFEKSKTQYNNFWQYDDIVANRPEGRKITHPEKVQEILDLWVYGKPSPTSGEQKVNPKEEFLFRSNYYFEDYAFRAPGGISLNQINPDDRDAADFKDIVEIKRFNQPSDFQFRQDKSNLELSVKSGEITLEELPSQPIQVNVYSSVNYYTYLRTLQENQQEDEVIPISGNEVQIFTAQQVNEMATGEGMHSLSESRTTEILRNHVRIKLPLKHKSNFAKILQDVELDHMIMEVFHNSQNNLETFTQVIDNKYSSPYVSIGEATRLNQITRADQIQNFVTPKKVKDPTYKIEQHIELCDNEEFYNQLRLMYPLGRPTGQRDQNFCFNQQALEDLHQRVRVDMFNRTSRNYTDILRGGNFAHSEIIAYKVVKSNPVTNEVLQTFYIFNENSTDDDGDKIINQVELIDTQVVPLESYRYSIFTINAVVGLEYFYQDIHHAVNDTGLRVSIDPHFEKDHQEEGILPNGEDPINFKNSVSGYYRFSVASKNHLSLIEAPYYTEIVELSVRPPGRPDIVFLPEVGVDNKFTLLFKPQLNSLQIEKPIAILEEDFQIIDNMLQAQGEEEVDRVMYISNSDPLVYELFLLDEPPHRYSDFSTGEIIKTGFYEPYVKLKININKNYYGFARCVDRGGISNPTEVFKLRLESHEDGINPVFEKYEMKPRLVSSKLNFQNVLSIEPAHIQRTLNTSLFERYNANSDSNSLEADFFESAPPIRPLSLAGDTGTIKKIWGKKFKFRLKSKSSSKAVDINVSFAEDKINMERSDLLTQAYQESSGRRVRQEQFIDLSTEQQYRYNSEPSDDNFEVEDPTMETGERAPPAAMPQGYDQDLSGEQSYDADVFEENEMYNQYLLDELESLEGVLLDDKIQGPGVPIPTVYGDAVTVPGVADPTTFEDPRVAAKAAPEIILEDLDKNFKESEMETKQIEYKTAVDVNFEDTTEALVYKSTGGKNHSPGSTREEIITMLTSEDSNTSGVKNKVTNVPQAPGKKVVNTTRELKKMEKKGPELVQAQVQEGGGYTPTNTTGNRNVPNVGSYYK